MKAIPRERYLRALAESLERNPAVALLGPRQCGKTTLARRFAEKEDAVFFDLERRRDRQRLGNPEQSLEPLRGLVVIDEAQRMPELFESLRHLLDREAAPARFLLLGSSSLDLVKGLSESLAGRLGYVDLGGFALDETKPDSLSALWLRGGFPRSFLSADDARSFSWREDFIRSFLERDLPQLGVRVPAETLRRFWSMVAHYHGQVWNGMEFARSLGATTAAARRYLDLLAGAYVLRVLPPWHENLKKRQVKAPKVYLRDSGLLHSLLEVEERRHLLGHPKVGASWEGFVLEQLLSISPTRSAYYWATHAGAELDLMLTIDGRRHGIECKFSDAPSTSRSMRTALNDLSLSHLWVVYPGNERYALDERITVVPAAELTLLVEELKAPR